MAPEVMQSDKAGYNAKADIWSLGITAMELAKGTPPYSHLSAMQVLIKTMREEPPTFESYPPSPTRIEFSKVFRSFIHDCLVKDPDERKTAAELLGHKFLKSAKQPALVALIATIPDLEETREDKPSVADLLAGIDGDSFTAAATASEAKTGYVKGTTWYFPDTSTEADAPEQKEAAASALATVAEIGREEADPADD